MRRQGILGRAAIVGGLTMLSRLAGLVRDMVLLRLFGAGAAMDAFFIAFKVPNLFRRVFAEGAASAALVPVFTKVRKSGHPALRRLVARTLALALAVLVPLCALVVAVPDILLIPFALGYYLQDAPQYALTRDLMRLCFPYLLLISLTSLAAAVLNSCGRFAAPASTPLLLNLCLIAAAACAAPWFEVPVLALGWGVLVAGMVQLAFQMPQLARLQMLPRPQWRPADAGVRRILALMLPAVVGASASQLNLLLDTLIASFLPTGSVTWLYQADRLLALPLGVFAIAMATVMLPRLASWHSDGDSARFCANLDWSLRCILAVALPAALALWMLAEPIISTLFEYGEFGPRDRQMSALALRGYAVGLCMLMAIKVLVPGYFARQDTRTPTLIGFVALAVNALASLVLVLALYSRNLGHLGLALATALATCVNAALLLAGLVRGKIWHPAPGWGLFGLRLVAACGLMALGLWGGAGHWGDWGEWAARGRVWRLLVLCCGGLALYLAGLAACGLRPRHLAAPKS